MYNPTNIILQQAIYNTTKWREQNDTSVHGIERGVYYTASKTSQSTVYAHSLDWPSDNKLTLNVPITTVELKVSMLGSSKPIKWAGSDAGSGLVITIPSFTPKELPSLEGPWVFKLDGVK